MRGAVYKFLEIFFLHQSGKRTRNRLRTMVGWGSTTSRAWSRRSTVLRTFALQNAPILVFEGRAIFRLSFLGSDLIPRVAAHSIDHRNQTCCGFRNESPSSSPCLCGLCRSASFRIGRRIVGSRTSSFCHEKVYHRSVGDPKSKKIKLSDQWSTA